MTKTLRCVQVIWNDPEGAQRCAEFPALSLGEEVAKTRAASRVTVLQSFGCKPQAFLVYTDGTSQETNLSLTF